MTTDRRTLLAAVGSLAGAGVAGCLRLPEDETTTVDGRPRTRRWEPAGTNVVLYDRRERRNAGYLELDDSIDPGERVYVFFGSDGARLARESPTADVVARPVDGEDDPWCPRASSSTSASRTSHCLEDRPRPEARDVPP